MKSTLTYLHDDVTSDVCDDVSHGDYMTDRADSARRRTVGYRDSGRWE